MTLTNEQVKALAEEAHDSSVTWESHTFTFLFIGREPIRRRVTAEDVRALAEEVQVARASRCENCRWLNPAHTFTKEDKTEHWCDRHNWWSSPTWSCADFQPQTEGE